MIAKLGPVMQAVFTLCVVGGFFGALWLLFHLKSDLQPGVGEVLLVMIGALGREFGNVGSFWLGTSLSSAKKDAAAVEAAKK